MRQRIASYSQESQRYVDMSDPEWVLPPAVAESPKTKAVWGKFAIEVKAAYRALRELGVRKEDARFVLPNAAATRIVVTMNFRELLHVFSLRTAIPVLASDLKSASISVYLEQEKHDGNQLVPLWSQGRESFQWQRISFYRQILYSH